MKILELFSRKQIQTSIQKLASDYLQSLDDSEICYDITEFNPNKHKCINVDAQFKSNLKIKDLGVCELINGTAYLSQSNVENLGNLRIVNGLLGITHSKITDLKNLTYVRGGLDISNLIKDIGNLTVVGGNFSITGDKIKDLKNLKVIGYDFFMESTNIQNFSNLFYVCGDINSNIQEQYDNCLKHLSKINERSIIDKQLNYGIINSKYSRLNYLTKGLYKTAETNTDSVVISLNQKRISLYNNGRITYFDVKY